MSVVAGRNFTKGTASTYTDTYTENATGTSVTRTYTIAYDGVNSFTITNPSPYFTIDLTSVRFTSQNAPTPTTNFNGLFSINGVNVEQPTLDATTLSPYGNRCEILSGGIFRFGKLRFIQMVIDINTTLSANNTWAVLQGLNNDLPVTTGKKADASTGPMTAITAVKRSSYGNIGAYISDAGRIVLVTPNSSLVEADVVLITGWYISE